MATKICNACNEVFKWEMPYTGKKLNLDGSPHNCAVTPAPQTGEAQVVVDSAGIMQECTAFLNAFSKEPDAQFDALARIYISRMMKR